MSQIQPISEDELVATERAAYIVYLLMSGKSLTTAEVAQELGVTHEGARQLMHKVSRRVPIRQELGFWFVVKL